MTLYLTNVKSAIVGHSHTLKSQRILKTPNTGPTMGKLIHTFIVYYKNGDQIFCSFFLDFSLVLFFSTVILTLYKAVEPLEIEGYTIRSTV